jgi:hypothetical protein
MSGLSETMPVLCFRDANSEEETEDDDHFFEGFLTTEQWDGIDQVEREALQHQQKPNDTRNPGRCDEHSGHSRRAVEAFHGTNEEERQQQLEHRKRLPRKDDEFHKFMQHGGKIFVECIQHTSRNQEALCF